MLIGWGRDMEIIDHPKSQRKRLPAFARELDTLRRRGQRPASETIVVHLDDWPPQCHRTRATDGTEVIVPSPPPCIRWPRITVPDDAEPGSLRYDFIAGLDVLVAHRRSRTAPARLRALLKALVASEPRAVIVLDQEHEPPKLWHVKSIALGVEVVL